MSAVVKALRAARGQVWADLIPAFDWAIHEALEAESEAEIASNKVLAGIPAAYPRIVTLLADAGTALADRDGGDLR